MRRSILLAFALLLGFVPFSAAAHASGGTTYTWVGSSVDPSADNHSWTDARNWNPGGVPGDGDSVVIAPPDASHCTASVDGIPSVSLVDLSVSQPPDLCGTSIHGGPITVSGTFSWNGGAVDTPLTLAAGSTGTVSATNGTRNAVWQNIEVDGSLTLDDLGGSGNLFFANYSALQLTIATGGTLTSTGTTEIDALSCCNAPGSIVNNGLLRVDSGRLHANNIGVDQHAQLSIASGATLDSDGGLANATAGAHYLGAGTWTIENGAKARFLGQQTLGTAFHLQLGTIGALSGAVFGGTFTINGAGTFDWSAGTLGGAVTVGKAAHLHVSGVTINNGRRQFAATDPTISGTTPSKLTNHGDITVDNGAAVSMAGTTTLTNLSDGTINLAPGIAISSSSCCSSPAVIANNGGQVVVDSAATSLPVVLSSLSYQDRFGTTAIAAGQQLQLTHGPLHRLTGTHVIGGGTLQLGGATALSGHVALSDGTTVALVSGGTIDGTATLNGDGALQWTGGSMSGNLTLAPAGGTSVSGTVAKSVQPISGGGTSTVHVRTALSFAAGTSSVHDYLDLGSNTLDLEGRTTMPAFVEIHAGTLNNTGALTVAAGADHADRTGPTAITVNTGTLAITSGTFAIVNTYQQTAGTLAITATANANGLLTVAHAASVAGTLRMVNHYHPTAGDSRTVLTAAGLTWTGTVTTTGTDSAIGQWVAMPTANALAVQWQPNA